MTKLVFFGTERESGLVLERLLEASYDVRLVVTKPDRPRGRGRQVDSPEVAKIARKYGVEVLQPETLGELEPILANIHANLGVLVSFGQIIPQSVIDIFPQGIVNIHPSLLPKYRGPSPIETAIVAGDSQTGVSLMSLSAKMDAGPIYIQEKISLDGHETKPTLYEKLFTVGSKLLVDNIGKIADGGLKPEPQDDTHASYCQLLAKADGQLDPSTMTAVDCERKVRAYLGFPKTRLNFRGNEIIVTKSHVAKSEAEYGLKCTDGQWLVIDELINPRSGKQMAPEAYLRGLR